MHVERPRLKIQADELSERWVARVDDHLAALEGPEHNVTSLGMHRPWPPTSP
jgi:hypothetical protein